MNQAKFKKETKELIEEDLQEYLKGLGGFEVESEIMEKENSFSQEEKGSLLLTLFYKKSNFNPDKPTYCMYKEVDGKKTILPLHFERTDEKGKKKVNPKALIGHLAIAPGIGKTTKTVSCLCKAGGRNIILVLPTEVLTTDAYNHHKGWLQEDYKCVYHKEIHGEYPTVLNDLVYWKNASDKDNIKTEGKKGVSVLKDSYLFSYLVRELCDTKKTDIKDNEIAQIKKKLIDKENTIIVFDEAHCASAFYRELIKQTIFLGYRTIKMSATFRGIPFSITSTYPISSKYMNFISEKMNSRLIEGKTLLFLKNTNLSNRQREVLDNGKVCYVILDKGDAAIAEEVVRHMPPGSLVIAGPDYEMGFSFDIDNAISTNEIEISDLNGDLITQRLSLASLIQQRGRVGRKKPGTWITLSKELKEIGVIEDINSIFVKACLSGNTYDLVKRGYANLKDINFIRTMFSLPENFGLYPEEILTGNKCSGNHKSFQTNVDKIKEILFLKIWNLIIQQKNLLKELKIEFDSPLIKEAKLTEEEVRKILNGIMLKKLDEAADMEETGSKYDKSKLKYKNRKAFEQIIACYKLLSGVKIEISQKREVSKKDGLILKLDYKESVNSTAL